MKPTFALKIGQQNGRQFWTVAAPLLNERPWMMIVGSDHATANVGAGNEDADREREDFEFSADDLGIDAEFGDMPAEMVAEAVYGRVSEILDRREIDRDRRATAEAEFK